MTHNPTKQDAYYIVEMLESTLITTRDTQRWSEQIIKEQDEPIAWVCVVASKSYHGDIVSAVREYAYSEPFNDRPEDLDKFHVGCLWVRYERGELSWATFLNKAGEYLDSENGEWFCETPYHYLNLVEEKNFTQQVEEQTKVEYLKEQNVVPWAELANSKLQWFR